MAELRRWALTPSHPLALQIAADARLSDTDYADDQVWELVLGGGESAALQLQTRYGGRAGLASLVPMWWIEKRPIFQYQVYAVPPVVTAFAPAYIETQAKITPKLNLKAEYRVIDSHAVGGRFSLKNTGQSTIDLRLDLIGFLAFSGQEAKLKILNRLSGGTALSFGKLQDITPVIILENGQPESGSTSKLITHLQLNGGASASIRWIHVGLSNASEGFAHADKLLKSTWSRGLRKITSAAADIPRIETGDIDTDAAVAFSYQQLVQSLLRPTMSMPFASFVGARQPKRGWSARGDGTDHIRVWSGQNPTLAYLTALAVAGVDPLKAQGIIRNYLAFQEQDGFIDWKPGLAGQKYGMLCLPILARLTWGIFQYTEDEAFLRETFPALLRFIGRWIKPDHDADRDGVFEWSQEAQTGYPYMPTFAVGLPYGQGADIRLIESPDLMAYLLSEANALKAVAVYLHDTSNEAKLNHLIERLSAGLESLWQGERYAYRDRDTHQTHTSEILLEHGHGDEPHILAFSLAVPSRLIVQIFGGVDHVPKITLTIEGADQNGSSVKDVIPAHAFSWSTGHGAFTTTTIFKSVDRVYAEGLSRVYKINVRTPDTTRLDINALLPIWSVGITPDRATQLVKQITDQVHFWLPNGISMISAADDWFSAAKTGEGGGIWAYWVTLIGEGLIEYGYIREAAELLKKLLNAQTAVLKAQKSFFEFYHTHQLEGLGETGGTSGIVPLHLLLRVLGVRIISPRKVWAGGEFAWGSPVTITHHSVIVRRDLKRTEVRFPSGHTVELPANAPMQEIIDPTPPPQLARPKTKRTKKEA